MLATLKLTVENPADRFARYAAATAELPAPFALLDRDALIRNARTLTARAGGLPIRVASKSVRSVPVLKEILALPGYAGVLAFTLPEAIHLARSGVSDDIVVAYPTVDRASLRTLARDDRLRETVTLMVDHPDHLTLLTGVLRDAGVDPHTTAFRVCLDLDMSFRFGGVHIGARRSPVHSVSQAVTAAAQIVRTAGVELVGVMGYEAQIAGVTDDSPAIAAMKRLSIPELTARRDAAVQEISALTPLRFVNGGGTGSLESTRLSTGVTELAAGSGLYGPHLFDRYRGFHPEAALHFALDVVRQPAPHLVTVLGGGWIASGAAGADRWPLPVWPEGLALTPTEGAGEVQTPLKLRRRGAQPAELPRIGDRVWFRHTKAGEVCEHVNTLHVISGDRLIAEHPTYRHEGYAFL